VDFFNKKLVATKRRVFLTILVTKSRKPLLQKTLRIAIVWGGGDAAERVGT
jgi:hypothetical protein